MAITLRFLLYVLMTHQLLYISLYGDIALFCWDKRPITLRNDSKMSGLTVYVVWFRIFIMKIT